MTRLRFLHLFLLLMAVNLAMAQNAMKRYEYWIDNDYKSRTVISSSQEDITFELSFSHVHPGLHYLNVRGQAENGVWGGLVRYMVYLAESGKNSEGLNDYEYWMDNDYEGRKVYSNSSLPSAITLDISNLSPGAHYFNYRAKSSSGEWGGLTRILVYLVQNGKNEEVLTEYEYWMDNDYMNKSSVKGAIPSNMLTIDVTDMKPGIHYFNFRAKSTSGQWGGLIRHLVYVFDQSTTNMQVKDVEYWIDDNYNHRQTQTVVGDSVKIVDIDISELDLTQHSFNFQGRTTNGECCLLGSYEFTSEALPIVPNPTITHVGNTITISDADSVDTSYPIAYHYTLDGTKPSRYSTLYEGPFEVLRNDTLKVVGIQYAHDPSEVVQLVIDWFKVADPHFAQVGKTLTITSDTARAAIYYKIGNGEEQLYEAPIRLADQQTVTAVGRYEGYFDSEMVTYQPRAVKSSKPAVAYNGRYLQLTSNEEGVSFHYTLDGSSPVNGLDVAEGTNTYHGQMTIDSLCTIKAVAIIDSMNVSDVQEYTVNYLYDGNTAWLRQPGSLSKAFEWCGGMNDVEHLSIEGTLNNTDVGLLKAVPVLTYLDMSKVTLSSSQLPNDAFAGSSLMVFVSPAELRDAGGRLFADCPQLAAVVWNADVTLRSNTFEGVNNPNLLLFVRNASLNQTSVNNVVVDGVADKITLTDATTGNNNFYCPQEFAAQDIGYTHSYQQETVIGKTQGWETLTLPFTVQTIRHERNGLLQPFGAENDGKPFWLMELGSGGLQNAQTIEANKPYVISMPNNPSFYADEYNQAGKVTFSANSVRIPVTAPQRTNSGNNTFVPTYQLVSKADTVFVLNVGDTSNGYLAGSVFLSNYRDVRPFEVYMPSAPESKRQAIALKELMDNTTGISDIPLKQDTNNDAWYTIDGRKLQNEPSSKGVYIRNGKKTVVK